eukprot:gene8553-6154_t
MSEWMMHSDRSVFLPVLSKNAASAQDAATYLLNVLGVDVHDENGDVDMAKRGDRFSVCDGSEQVDHCLVDLLEAHSLSLLFLNAKTIRTVQSPTPIARNSPRWDDTIGQLSFLVPDADRCIATASELGGMVISEVLGDTDKAFLIKSPFEYTFTVIETTNLATKNIASVYLKTISSETIALCAVGDQYRLITPNATDPIPFSNDIFEGKMLLMVRSSLPMDDKFSQRFDIDKNMFELQVQGRFKRIPSGYMYLGGEITKKMELGLLTRGFASSLLQFCKSFNASIHHSYGDSQQVELPHIVGPFWSIIDRVVVTPPGELPPPFIKGFPEPPESRAARRAGNPLHSVKPPLDLDSTYSFSFKTRYVDLESWAVISVPLMKEFKLQTFWSDADLRFVAYFIDPDKVELDAKGFPKIHAQASLDRLFTLELQNAANHPEWKDNPSAAYYVPQADATVSSSSHGNSLSLSVGSSGASVAVDSASLTAALLDIQERQRQRQQSLASATPLPASSLQSQLAPQTPPPPSTAAATGVVFSPDLSVHTLPSRSDDQRRSSLGFADALSHLVTAVIEVDELRKTSSNNRRVLYAFAVFPREYLAGNVLAVSTQSVLRTYREWKDCLPVIKANKKQAAYDRWSETEQRRWQLDDSYRYLLQDAEKNHATRTRLESFLVAAPHTDHFLEATILSSTQTTQAAHSPSFVRLVQQLHELRDLTAAAAGGAGGADREKAASTVPLPAASFTAMLLSQLESNVCVRTGNFHWSQEHLSVTDTDVVLRRPGKRLGTIAKQTIPLTSVLDVRPLVAPSSSSTTAAMAAAAAASSSSFHETDAVTTTHPTLPIQLADLAGFVVTTFPRQYVVLVRGGVVARDVWVQALQVAVGRAMATAAAAADSGGGVRPTSLSTSSSASSRRQSMKTAAAAAADAAAGRETDSFSEKWSYAAAAAVPSAAASIASNDALRAAFVAATSNGFEPQELLATPPSWQLNDRVILNARSFRLFELHRWHFCDPLLPFVSSAASGTAAAAADAPVSMSYAELWRRQDSPVELVEWLLDLVLHIAHVTATGAATNSPSASTNSASTASTSNAASSAAASSLALSRAWMLFLDGVTLLQTLSLASMDLASPEAVAMFVNVFHLMLLHALLVLGPPTSLFKWQALFRNIAYEAFGDIFTLAELEHNIIKHHMSRPSVNFIAKSFIPTSVYSFALQVRDYRILFALNSASTSNLPYVPVYTPRHLSRQLDAVLRLSLEQQLIVHDAAVDATPPQSGGTVTITMPQTCQWYAKDFLHLPPTGAKREKLALYLGRMRIDQGRLVKYSLNFKYSAFEFNCQVLHKLDDGSSSSSRDEDGYDGGGFRTIEL